MAKGIQRKIDKALLRIQAEMANHGGGTYARGLSSEGYAGGYAQALRDVSLLLRGIHPGGNRGYWDEFENHLDKKRATATARAA